MKNERENDAVLYMKQKQKPKIQLQSLSCSLQWNIVNYYYIFLLLLKINKNVFLVDPSSIICVHDAPLDYFIVSSPSASKW